MKLSELFEGIAIVSKCGTRDPEVKGIAFDSRKVRSGWVFIAVSGFQLDGAEFISQALESGAVAVVSENELTLAAGLVHFQVSCAREALADLAVRFYGNASASLRVVGITGTNGKTTSAYMIRDVLRGGGLCPGLLGTVAYEVGEHIIPADRTTPEAPEIQDLFQKMKRAECDSVVMEVSSHAIALGRVRGVEFDVAVFTNLTQDHLDYHHDMPSYFDVKSKLFLDLLRGQGRAAVVNVDDPWGRILSTNEAISAEVVTCGFADDAMVRASALKISSSGTEFQLESPWGSGVVRLRLLGRFNVYNALQAIAVGGLSGIELPNIIRSLRGIQSIPGRLELVRNRERKKIFVDYAHTDDALRNVLSTAREICKGRLLVLFGCGGNRDVGKRAKMGAVAAELADYSFITSDNPRNEEPESILSDIVEGFSDLNSFEIIVDRRAAIGRAIKYMGRKDLLVIAGKGHETYQEIQGTVIPFDDREVAREGGA